MPPRRFNASVAPPPPWDFNNMSQVSAPYLLIPTEAHGIKLEIISPGGTISPEQPEFDNIVHLAIDIVEDNAPRLSICELHNIRLFIAQQREAILINLQRKTILFLIEVSTDDTRRVKAIDDMLQSVDAGTLDSDTCSICMELYDTATTAVTFNDHGISKLPKCGHVFGRHCITHWLELNDTCPMCREKVTLKIPYKLRVWVRCDSELNE
ncbi:hypothetical protein EAF04_008311 [Stromatinia cepivora]|nr:hypothetical protein EAF04_008311 [Stromatinia cepivora]